MEIKEAGAWFVLGTLKINSVYANDVSVEIDPPVELREGDIAGVHISADGTPSLSINRVLYPRRTDPCES